MKIEASKKAAILAKSAVFCRRLWDAAYVCRRLWDATYGLYVKTHPNRQKDYRSRRYSRNVNFLVFVSHRSDLNCGLTRKVGHGALAHYFFCSTSAYFL